MSQGDIFLEPDEPEDDELNENPPIAAGDNAPQSNDENTSYCPYCERAPFTGIFRQRGLSLHVRAKHPEENEQWRAASSLRPSDPAAGYTPPKNLGAKKAKTDSAPRGSNRVLTDVRENVEFFYTMAGSLLAMRDPYCGPCVQQIAKPAADAWVNLAKTNSKVRAFWAAGAGTTTWLQLAFAHMPLVFAVQQHHLFPRLEARRMANQGVIYEDGPVSVDDLSGQAWQDAGGQDDIIGQDEQQEPPSPTLSDIGFPDPEHPITSAPFA